MHSSIISNFEFFRSITDTGYSPLLLLRVYLDIFLHLVARFMSHYCSEPSQSQRLPDSTNIRWIIHPAGEGVSKADDFTSLTLIVLCATGVRHVKRDHDPLPIDCMSVPYSNIRIAGRKTQIGSDITEQVPAAICWSHTFSLFCVLETWEVLTVSPALFDVMQSDILRQKQLLKCQRSELCSCRLQDEETIHVWTI